MSILSEKYTWAGKAMTGREWADEIGVTPQCMGQRLRKWGPGDKRTFASARENRLRQLKKHAWPARDASWQDRKTMGFSGHGNAEWRALGK